MQLVHKVLKEHKVFKVHKVLKEQLVLMEKLLGLEHSKLMKIFLLMNKTNFIVLQMVHQ